MNKFESYPAVKKFQHELKKLEAESPSFVVGVSGGPDSMALLYIMHRLNLNPFVVHCNYQLRGNASDDDQKLVEEVCALWELECVSVKINPEKNESKNFQLWARNQRYSIFRDILREQSADFIVTAHHEDDQLETILQKILRGSGISAWKGISVRDNDLFRPILNVNKSEIMKFVQDQNVPYRIDSSNEESTYARNFLRHQWFPKLQNLFPGWRKNLLKLTDRAEEYDLMTDYVFHSISDSPNAFRKKEFLELPEEIQKSMIYKLLNKNGYSGLISDGMLNNVSNLYELQTGKALKLSEKVKIVSDRDQFILAEESSTFLQWEVTKREIQDGIEIDGIKITEKIFSDGITKGKLNLDVNKLKFPIKIRTWQDGDEIIPLGMKGSQKISDHLTNRKVRPSQKNEAIVIESFDGTICAIIFPHIVKKNQIGTISEYAKCTADTKKILTIQKI